jgi:NhaP-type Na+/H+ or K+/H+ antiporter
VLPIARHTRPCNGHHQCCHTRTHTHTLTQHTCDLADKLTFSEAASFGGLISATDPVAVLAILGQLRVEPALFYLVFGESVLNDAVSLVIYNIASKFIGDVDHGATVRADAALPLLQPLR